MSSTAQPIEGAVKKQLYGTGRRKNAVARVFITPGSGKFEVNRQPVNEYFRNVDWLMRAVEPLKFTDTDNAVGRLGHGQRRRALAGSRARCAWGFRALCRF